MSVESESEELLDAFRVAVEIARRGFPPTGAEARRIYRIILLRTLRDQGDRLGAAPVDALRRQLQTATGDRTDEPEELASLVEEILGTG